MPGESEVEAIIVRFPEYKIQGCDTEWNRQCVSQKLREEFSLTTRQNYCVLIQFVGEHSSYVVEQAAGYCNPLDKRIIDTIKSQAQEGCVNLSEIQHRCEQSASSINNRNPCDTRFIPSRKNVYNHVYNTHADPRTSSEITQFEDGMNDVGDMWELLTKNADTFQPLFCHLQNHLVKGRWTLQFAMTTVILGQIPESSRMRLYMPGSCSWRVLKIRLFLHLWENY